MLCKECDKKLELGEVVYCGECREYFAYSGTISCRKSHTYDVLNSYMPTLFRDLEEAGCVIDSFYSPMILGDYNDKVLRVEYHYVGGDDDQLIERLDGGHYTYMPYQPCPVNTHSRSHIRRGVYCRKTADKAYDYWKWLDHSEMTISQHIKTATFYAVHDTYFAIHLMQYSLIWDKKPEDARMYCSIFLLRLVRHIVEYYHSEVRSNTADHINLSIACELMD